MTQNLETSLNRERYVETVGELLSGIPDFERREMLDELRTHIASLEQSAGDSGLDVTAVLGDAHTYAIELMYSAGYAGSVTPPSSPSRSRKQSILAICLTVLIVVVSAQFWALHKNDVQQQTVVPSVIGSSMNDITHLLPLDPNGQPRWRVCLTDVVKSDAPLNQILTQDPEPGLERTTFDKQSSACLNVTVSNGLGSAQIADAGTPYCALYDWTWKIISISKSPNFTEIRFAARNPSSQQCIATGFPHLALAGPYISSQATDGTLSITSNDGSYIPGILVPRVPPANRIQPVAYVSPGISATFVLKLPLPSLTDVDSCKSIEVNNVVVSYGNSLGHIFEIASSAGKQLNICTTGKLVPTVGAYETAIVTN